MTTLHPTRTLPTLVPRYVTRFACIGPSCEDNCCTGWKVTIDKKTFNAYRQSKNPELADRFEDKVRRQRSQASDAAYARIEMTPGSGQCPFMEEKLCAVQRELGEDLLSDTCATFPRHTRSFGGQAEQALTLSCPEAARLALLAPDAFDFVTDKMGVRASMLAEVKPKLGLPIALMNEVRIFCLQLMRTDGLELWQRLAVLGVFCERLTDLVSHSGHAKVPALLESFTQMVESGSVIEALGDMPANLPAQAKVFAFFWCTKAKPTVSPVQNGVIRAIARAFGASETSGEVSAEQVVERYSLGVSKLPQALEAAPHLLENYVLNEMFKDLFPFGGANPYEQYLQLISRFGLVRLVLAAQCAPDGPLPEPAAMATTVQVFCRRFQHDSAFAHQVNQALSDARLDRLEAVYGFLRA